MQKKLFLKCLKRMFELHKGEENYWCPAAKVKITESQVGVLKVFHSGDRFDPVAASVCSYCKSTAKVEGAMECPCFALGRKLAVRRGKAFIRKYEKKHGVVL